MRPSHFRLPAAILAALLALGIGADTAFSAEAEAAVGAASTDGSQFVRARGPGLVLDGKPFRLRAVNFSNFYYLKMTGADLLASPHHSASDFARVREMGFNSIRFAFDGDWYAEFPKEFLAWLDANVALARQHGLYLILDLHTPIGSFWLDPTSDDVNFDIWTDEAVRAQNLALWRDLAERYRNEPTIAAYDILNEPVTVDATGDQWRELAQEMVDIIRSVDTNHLIVVGSLYGVEESYSTLEVERHFLVDDDNAAYDFHFYEPIKFTHQYASWMDRPIKDGGRYPDPDVILPTGGQVLLPDSRISTPSISEGDTGWTLYDSGLVTITDESAVAAIPIASVRGAFLGTVYFDGLRVVEYAPDGSLIRQLVHAPLAADDALHWYSWQEEDGSPSVFERAQQGYKDDASLSITGGGWQSGLGEDNVAGWSSDDDMFKVTPGNQYRVLGYMRGRGVDLKYRDAVAEAALELDVYAGAPDAPGGGFFERGKDYLEYEMMKSLAFGAEHKVPMSVMEFGLVSQNFEPGVGGGKWVADVIDLLEKHNASFAYWEYHGDAMGIYMSEAEEREAPGPPAEPNPELIDTLIRELAAR